MILVGDCIEQLAGLPEKSVQCCVTSPPYWGLRDYQVAGQLGLEKTPEEYVAKMVEVFRAVRRVLRDDGTLWLNLGDSYNGSGAVGQRVSSGSSLRGQCDKHHALAGGKPATAAPGLKPKDLVGIPWRVGFALQADGWYLRSDIIWAKPNPMPESVTDRPTKAHEYVFLLSKSARYFYDADAVKEAAANPGASSERKTAGEKEQAADAKRFATRPVGRTCGSPERRNKRSVWTVTTQPYPGAHFAVMPPKLVEPCVLAGSPVKACAECGAPWVRVVETGESSWARRRADGDPVRYGMDGNAAALGRSLSDAGDRAAGGFGVPASKKTTGFASSCECNAGTAPATILDPFAGTATVGVVAKQHGREFIGCELNPEYAELAHERLAKEAGQGLLFTPQGEVLSG